MCSCDISAALRPPLRANEPPWRVQFEGGSSRATCFHLFQSCTHTNPRMASNFLPHDTRSKLEALRQKRICSAEPFVQEHTHSAVLLTKIPPLMFTTMDVGPSSVRPQATIAPPISRATLSVNVPPSIVTLEPPKLLLFPSQYTYISRTRHTRQDENTGARLAGFEFSELAGYITQDEAYLLKKSASSPVLCFRTVAEKTNSCLKRCSFHRWKGRWLEIYSRNPSSSGGNPSATRQAKY